MEVWGAQRLHTINFVLLPYFPYVVSSCLLALLIPFVAVRFENSPYPQPFSQFCEKGASILMISGERSSRGLGRSHVGSFGDVMKTRGVYLEKRLVLRTHVVLRQAAACLHHAKLRWDAENGWQELCAFYAGYRGEYLYATLEEWLLHGGKVVSNEVRRSLDQEICQSLTYSHYFTLLFRLLTRLRRCCRFKQHELDFVASCLTEFVTLLADSAPPPAVVGKHLEGKLITAEYCVEMRSGFMPEMAKSSRVERIYPPPAGPIYTYDEIVSVLK